MFLHDLTTHHLAILDLHAFSCDDTQLLLLGRYDEEESIIEIFLSYTIFVEQLESDIQELVSLSMRDEYCEDLLSGLVFVIGELGREELGLFTTEYS